MVQFLITVHLCSNKDVNKLKSFLKKLVTNIWGDNLIKKLTLPRLSIDYNNWMGGVDIHDQLRSYYTTQITTVRTWLPLFFWALDAAVINAYIIGKKIF